MTALDIPDRSSSLPDPESGMPVQFDRARVRTNTRSPAMVMISIRGEIDALNAERVSQYVRRFLSGDRPMVVDMTDVNFIAAPWVAHLYELADDCARAGVDWALVANHLVKRLVLIVDRDGTLPLVGSLVEALQRLGSRRATGGRLG